MTIDRNVNVEIVLTPEELAEEFWRMSDREQAGFFNHLAHISASGLIWQLQAITDEPTLSLAARYVMEKIGEYAPKSVVRGVS